MSIVARIKANGGAVTRDEWRLKLRRGELSEAALKWVAANRDALMREVWPAYDEWLERAAIREFDGGQDRAEAERDAYREVMARA